MEKIIVLLFFAVFIASCASSTDAQLKSSVRLNTFCQEKFGRDARLKLHIEAVPLEGLGVGDKITGFKCVYDRNDLNSGGCKVKKDAPEVCYSEKFEMKVLCDSGEIRQIFEGDEFYNSTCY